LVFTISGKHVEITDALKKHAQQRSSKLPRYYSSINNIEVVIDGSDGGKISVEVIARAAHNNVFIAKQAGTDAYACIDTAIHKLERRLRKAKEKQRNNKHSGSNINYATQ